MAFLHKISGYLVDINEEYFEEDIVTELEERLDLSSQQKSKAGANMETLQDREKGKDISCISGYRECR